MKRLSLLTCTLGMLGAAGAMIACVSDDNAQPGPGADSGLPVGDSSVSLPGNDATTPQPDGGVPDAGTDSPLADAGPQPVTITVVSATGPEANVPIVLDDASGSYLSTTMTDGAGEVIQMMTTGTQVTAVFGYGTGYPTYVTLQGVVSGQSIRIVDPGSSAFVPASSIDVTTPAPTWDAASAYETLWAGSCNNSSNGDQIQLSTDCTSQGAFPLLAQGAVSTDGGLGYTELGYTYAKNNPVDAGLDDAGDLAFDITRPWSTSSLTQSIAITKAPTPDATDGGPSFNAGYIHVAYAEISGNVPVRADPTDTSADDAGVTTSAYVMHTGFPDAVQTEAYDTFSNESNDTYAVVASVTRTAPPSSSQAAAVDLSALPLITSASIDDTDAGTPDRPLVSWTVQAGTSTPVAMVANLQFYAPPLDGGNLSVQGSWVILTPATATSLTPPAMPAQYAPPAGLNYGNIPQLALVQGSLIPDYASIGPVFEAVGGFFSGNWVLQLPALPADGSLSVSGFYPDEG